MPDGVYINEFTGSATGHIDITIVSGGTTTTFGSNTTG